ncbi:hypothetical protein ZOSMA_99G00160 [Zostera marina]|uniref:RING-type E3 ubiquitin transferase n=1 Tax=Zostera marina TaxID=29655 RepID=A0A0K9NH47_ZOSMR|nr:hypothetical protein ZOSMA_99G00160 [Zostera marina]
MGGCCSSGKNESEDRIPVIFYCPEVLENEPFSSARSTISMISSGILVDTNMDTSSPDTYRAPPLPMPYDSKMSSVTSVNSQMLAHILNADAIENSATSEILKKSKDKEKIESTEVDDIKFEKLDELRYSESEDDDCPICLEEYCVENPRIFTKCEHHFHFSCVLEWMERSDVCPICDQVVIFNNISNK